MNKVSIIGGGTMGNGIAQTFASHGSSVTLVDVDEGCLSRAMAAIEKSLARFVKKRPGARPTPALDNATLCAVLVETDDKTGLARSVDALRLGGVLREARPASRDAPRA